MAQDDDDMTRWNPARLQWVCIAIGGVAAAGLGFWGFCAQFRAQGNAGSLLDAMYQTFGLFTFQFSGELGTKPWPLEVARFLAPAVTSYTVVVTLLRVMGLRWQLWRTRGHAVVCGLGCKGVYLAKSRLRRGQKVVIIEADEDNDWIEVCRSLGAVVLNGEAADEDMLRQARVAEAAEVIAVCENDTTNIQIAVLACAIARDRRRAGLPPLHCLVHIVSLTWCASLRSLGVLDGSESACVSVSFNFFENSARSVLAEHPLDRGPIAPDDPRQVHLVLIGANDMAVALLVQAIRVAHFANVRPPRVTVIGEDADREKDRFHAQFPQAYRVAAIEFRRGEAQDPVVRRDLAAWAADEASLMTVAVCAAEETAAMETALTLPAELRARGIPVFVRLAEETGIAGVLEAARQKLGVFAFGSIHDGCRIRDDLDHQPRALHEVYLLEAQRAGHTPDTDPAMRPWDRLNAGFKDSNRQAADHIPIKLRAVGCLAVPAQEAPDEEAAVFTREEVELLARMEHARWCAERFLAGWTPGPMDKPRLISPYLVPYDELADSVQEYDRVSVRSIAAILRDHAGLKVVRRPPAPPISPA